MSTGAYRKSYDASIADPQAFWGEAAKDIDWITPPTQVLDDSNPPFYRWVPRAAICRARALQQGWGPYLKNL